MADTQPPAATAETFAALDAQEFAVLTTSRRDGTPVPTTVWLAHDGGRLFIQTGLNAGKIKRIRGNSAVTLAPSTRMGEVLGDAVAATARILSPEEAGVADAALARKYGARRQQVMAQMGVSELNYLEISPRA